MSSISLKNLGFHMVAIVVFLQGRKMQCGLLMELLGGVGVGDKEIFMFQKGFVVFGSRATMAFFGGDH